MYRILIFSLELMTVSTRLGSMRCWSGERIALMVAPSSGRPPKARSVASSCRFSASTGSYLSGSAARYRASSVQIASTFLRYYTCAALSAPVCSGESMSESLSSRIME